MFPTSPTSEVIKVASQNHGQLNLSWKLIGVMGLPHFVGLEGESMGGDRIVTVSVSQVFGLTVHRAPDLSSQ